MVKASGWEGKNGFLLHEENKTKLNQGFMGVLRMRKSQNYSQSSVLGNCSQSSIFYTEKDAMVSLCLNQGVVGGKDGINYKGKLSVNDRLLLIQNEL